jgi:hypothetical protein
LQTVAGPSSSRRASCRRARIRQLSGGRGRRRGVLTLKGSRWLDHGQGAGGEALDWPNCPRRDYNTCMYRHHILHLGAWLPIIIVIAILIFAFEIWMIVDAAINKEITDKAKTWWIIGMLIIHPFVAIAYFFTDHRKR